MVSYASDTPSAVGVDADGRLTLLNNHHQTVSINATSSCSPEISTIAATAPNLAVPFRGVDLGANNGLQFSMGDGGALSVPVVVNALGVKMT